MLVSVTLGFMHFAFVRQNTKCMKPRVTHTILYTYKHTFIYMYVCMYVCVCVCSWAVVVHLSMFH